MKRLLIILIPVLLLLISCSKSNDKAGKSSNPNNDYWLVDTDDILYMNLEKDRIKSLDNPEFVKMRESQIDDEEKVLFRLTTVCQ